LRGFSLTNRYTNEQKDEKASSNHKTLIMNNICFLAVFAVKTSELKRIDYTEKIYFGANQKF